MEMAIFTSVSDWQRAGEMTNPPDVFAQTDVQEEDISKTSASPWHSEVVLVHGCSAYWFKGD